VFLLNLKDIMAKEMQKDGSSARVIDVPNDRRPTADSLRRLQEEISSQVSANEAMRSRSLQNASKMSCK